MLGRPLVLPNCLSRGKVPQRLPGSDNFGCRLALFSTWMTPLTGTRQLKGHLLQMENSPGGKYASHQVLCWGVCVAMTTLYIQMNVMEVSTIDTNGQVGLLICYPGFDKLARKESGKKDY